MIPRSTSPNSNRSMARGSSASILRIMIPEADGQTVLEDGRLDVEEPLDMPLDAPQVVERGPEGLPLRLDLGEGLVREGNLGGDEASHLVAGGPHRPQG